MIRRVVSIVLLLVASLVGLAGCGRSSGPDTAKAGSVAVVTESAPSPTGGRHRLQLVTTVSPITSIVSRVAGDAADVHGVVPEGTNSHTFEPSPKLAKQFAKADVVYVNGLQLEEPTVKLAEKNIPKTAIIVELGSATITDAEQIFDFSFPKEDGRPNPHLWTNPHYARRYCELVRDDLKQRDPANAATYDANATAFIAQIDALSSATEVGTATVPSAARKLLTYHDSFPYFARDFGWTVIGAIQPSDFAEPTPKEVVSLIEQVRKEKVPVIFGSEVFPSAVLEQIGKEAGVKYVDTLRDDDLPGNPGDPEHSYLGLMRADFVTIVSALGGDPSALKALDISAPNDTAEYPQ